MSCWYFFVLSSLGLILYVLLVFLRIEFPWTDFVCNQRTMALEGFLSNS